MCDTDDIHIVFAFKERKQNSIDVFLRTVTERMFNKLVVKDFSYLSSLPN